MVVLVVFGFWWCCYVWFLFVGGLVCLLRGVCGLVVGYCLVLVCVMFVVMGFDCALFCCFEWCCLVVCYGGL